MAQLTRRTLLGSTAASVVLAQTGAWAQGARPPAAAPAAAAVADTEWHHYASDLAATRYVPLDQINASNFNNLEVAWTFRTDSFGPQSEGSNQCTPVLAKGKLYVTAGLRRVVACLDATSGEVLWTHREDETGRTGARGGSGHGVSYWTDGTIERILYVTIGYQLISLDAKTGLKDPNFGNKGVVDLRLDNDQPMNPQNADNGLHATPLIAKNTIVVGCAHSGGGNPRVRENVKGYVRAFDVKTGKRKWIFHTIPQKGEYGYESWIEAGQAEKAGNAGVWGELSADEQLGMVYIGVELPTGDTVGMYRKGNALFGESLVALDLETGQRKWHFQMVHHGIWDYDVPCAAILCDIPVNGKIVKAIAQPTKQAWLYVLDRTTGKPIWPIVEKAVPKGDVPGEWYSPTQPFPSKPPAFDRQGVTPDILNDWTPEIKKRALEIVSHYKIGPIFTPPVVKKDGGLWGTLALPNQQGGANWGGGSYDPETSIAYVYSKTVVNATVVAKNANYNGQNFEYSTGMFAQTAGTGGIGGGGPAPSSNNLTDPLTPGMISIAGLPIHKPPYGRITALDLKKGTILWQVAHGETPDNIKNHPLLKGVTIPRTGQAALLGTLNTKNLVICGDGGVFTDEQGRRAARLRAYDKMTGQEKGAVFMPAAQTGAAMTYMSKGVQHIVTPIAGNGFGSALIAYRLKRAAPAAAGGPGGGGPGGGPAREAD
jgi:quinoprotein glucose dehydrogenase